MEKINVKPDSLGIKNYSLYQKMVEEVQDYAIILLDQKGMIQNWNAGAEKIKFYKENEIIGKHFSIFYFEEDVNNQLPLMLLNGAEQSGRAYHEGWRKRKDGTGFWGSITITALHDDTDKVIGFVKITRDLTEKKLAEERLKLSEERYHQMVSEVQDYAIILLDQKGIIQNWNAGAEKIKGYSSEEIIGKRFSVFYTEGDLASGLPDKLLDLARTEGKATQEGWRVRKDGTTFWGTIVITALHGKNGDIIGFSKVTRDLTDKKLAEDKMIAYTAELEIRNRELEQFAYVASHDLQEPLRKIKTFVHLINGNFDDPDLIKKYLTKTELSANRMSQLIASILNFGQLAKNQQEKTTVDLNVVLANVLEDLDLIIAEKKAKIHWHILPVIDGYALQMEQLFSNIISNSLKFSTETPEINISSHSVLKDEIPDAPDFLLNNRYICLCIQDNGIGFEPQYSKLIFSLFQRLHGKQEYEGTGIGLALCKKIIENHNGYIIAEGKPNQGSTMCIYLPDLS